MTHLLRSKYIGFLAVFIYSLMSGLECYSSIPESTLMSPGNIVQGLLWPYYFPLRYWSLFSWTGSAPMNPVLGVVQFIFYVPGIISIGYMMKWIIMNILSWRTKLGTVGMALLGILVLHSPQIITLKVQASNVQSLNQKHVDTFVGILSSRGAQALQEGFLEETSTLEVLEDTIFMLDESDKTMKNSLDTFDISKGFYPPRLFYTANEKIFCIYVPKKESGNFMNTRRNSDSCAATAEFILVGEGAF